ncbi:LysM domain protein [Bacteriovorax sp. BAL6_X]|uniref:LysM peptidoglycan-binding domain-containing protein n=1 Tax=Bacteriovorax sp. BAL6_X TaxID=1201290 RepID=UPI0003869B87|nr:LysM peptidoglycan-binding domain-containing protein [Bacteriovorax sp. BAL6_X]EPZ52357.1 LysM domain protein [Bacteriovorax sp. BAL6_X]
MKKYNFTTVLFIALIFQSCSFDTYRLYSDENSVVEGDTLVLTQDDLVFNLGTDSEKNDLLRSDTIYEDIPKRNIIEKETSFKDNRAPASASIDYDLYVVQKFDTTMKIAFYLYKDIRRWKEIRDLNGTVDLHVGQTIKVPRIPENIKYIRPEGEPYLIKKDDTLGKISQYVYEGNSRFWINIWDNNKEIIDDYDLIFPGFTLYYKDFVAVQKEYRTVRKKYDFSNPKRREISSEKK